MKSTCDHIVTLHHTLQCVLLFCIVHHIWCNSGHLTWHRYQREAASGEDVKRCITLASRVEKNVPSVSKSIVWVSVKLCFCVYQVGLKWCTVCHEKRSWTKPSTACGLYVKVVSLRNRKRYMRHLIHLLFTQASSEIVSVKGWLSKSPS